MEVEGKGCAKERQRRFRRRRALRDEHAAMAAKAMRCNQIVPGRATGAATKLLRDSRQRPHQHEHPPEEIEKHPDLRAASIAGGGALLVFVLGGGGGATRWQGALAAALRGKRGTEEREDVVAQVLRGVTQHATRRRTTKYVTPRHAAPHATLYTRTALTARQRPLRLRVGVGARLQRPGLGHERLDAVRRSVVRVACGQQDRRGREADSTLQTTGFPLAPHPSNWSPALDSPRLLQRSDLLRRSATINPSIHIRLRALSARGGCAWWVRTVLEVDDVNGGAPCGAVEDCRVRVRVDEAGGEGVLWQTPSDV